MSSLLAVISRACCFVGAFAALGVSHVALAATLNVNSTADQLIAGNGQCTLREAIINANGDRDTTAGDCAAGSSADLINVPAGTYVLTGFLHINSDLTLRGAGAATTAIVQTTSDPVVNTVGFSLNVVIERLRVTGTGSGVQSGISTYGGHVIVSDAIISESGWGIVTGGGGHLLLRRSAVINNGLGVVLFPDSTSPPTARIESSTISGNHNGGMVTCWPLDGICLFVEVSNSIIADNGGYGVDIALVRGTLLDNNGSGNCRLPGDDGFSLGHNLDSDGSCGFTDPTDLSNVDPLLGPLQSNGGPTPTHALLRGSPAIDRIPTADCTYDHDGNPATPEVALTQDQRGGARPREGNGASPTGCDVGAYEVAACADGLDNDGDGRVDFDGGVTAGLTPLGSPDPNCGSALGNSEAPPPAPWGCGLGPELAPALLLLLIGRRRSRFAAWRQVDWNRDPRPR